MKVPLTTLKNALVRTRHRTIFIAILITLIFLTLQDGIYAIISAMYGYYIYKNQRDIIVILSVFGITYLLLYSLIVNIPINQGAQSKLVVSEVLSVEDYTSCYGYHNFQRVKVVLSAGEDIKEGDHIILTGDFKEIEPQTIPGNFDYRNYLLSKNIRYQVYSEDYEIVKKSNLIYTPKILLKNYINENIPKSKRYVLTFVMADKSYFDQDIKDAISLLGISHIFALSGMHIALLVFALQWILSNTALNRRKKETITFGFLGLFMIITSFTASVVRSALMYMLSRVNKILELDWSILDVISIVFIGLILIRPMYFYDMGFSLSFLVVYTIILFRELLTDQAKTNQLFTIGVMSLLVTIPITYSFNYQLNVLSLVFNVVFLYIVMFFIMPLTYILLVLPSLDSIFHYIFMVFDQILIYSKLVNIFTYSLTFKHNSIIILYYICLYIAVKTLYNRSKYYRIMPYVIIVFVVFNSRLFDFSDKIAFLDVKGDSIVLLDNQNRCNIVIDSGENDEYDSVINYLRYQGLTSIDHIFVSHYHADHFGEMEDIYNSFNVDNIWYNDSTNLPSDGFYCGDFFIQVLKTSRIWENENNSSLVIYIEINNDIYLFTGDIEYEREMELLSLYDFKVDYLKVSHHGSNTSSTEDFLERFSPREGIIMVKKFNKYKHPHDVVIQRYDQMNIPINRTDLDGSIEFVYYFKKVYKKYYRK